ncbi:MAG TPA: glycoside hydrolase family 15 protein, partial [Gammaproteobacteria bacterium]
LQTFFTTPTGLLQLTDFMSIHGDEARRLLQPQREILRIIEVLEGEVEVEVFYQPRPDYGRHHPKLRLRGALGFACEYRDQLFLLHSDMRLALSREEGCVHGRITLTPGDKRHLSLSFVQDEIAVILPLGEQADRRMSRTVGWWREWSDRCTYNGPYRDMVLRSVLTLKLMTYSLSGALIAAPTTSLPEELGGVRNWDYRYCWLRDAALTLRAFMDLGFTEEGRAFLNWLLHATRLTWPRLQVLYDVHGESRVPEFFLEHLEGYKGSKPVRIGNAADMQIQMDVYGEVVLASYNFVLRGGNLDRVESRLLSGFGRVVCRHWRDADHGIWERRDQPRHHTYSKLMCWVALDRLLKLHEWGKVKVPEAEFRRERDAIRHSIETQAYDERLQSFTVSFEDKEIDSSLLLLSRYGFIDPRDPRMAGTFARIERELTHNGLVHRYPRGYDDFLPPGEGAFFITSFWSVSYFASVGDLESATKRFERLLHCANDLGLLSEEADVATGELLGNFPQAFSHLGLITAALSLMEAERMQTVTHE